MVRTQYAPANPETCPIEVVNVPASMLGPMNTDHEMLGNVVVQSFTPTNPDPFGPDRLALIRPKACGLGGDTVSLGTEAGGLTMYSVMRKRGGGNAATNSAATAIPSATATP